MKSILAVTSQLAQTVQADLGQTFLLLRQFKDNTTFLPFPAEPHSSVDSVADLRTRGRRFDPQLGQSSF